MFKENEAVVEEIRIVGCVSSGPIIYKNVKIWTCESPVPMLVVDLGEGKTVFNLNNVEGYTFKYKEDK